MRGINYVVYFLRLLGACIAAGGLALSITGCAGTNFSGDSVHHVRNGQTTYSQVLQEFGSPYREDVHVKNNKVFKTVIYSFASKFGNTAKPDVTASRGLILYFLEDVVV